MWDIMVRGGPLMWPLLACSVVSLAVIIERVVFWALEARGRDEATVERLLREAEQGRFDQAAAIGQQASDLAARVLAAGLAHRDWGLSEAMEVAAEEELRATKRGLAVLDTIITLAPLLGILGTVLGIIVSFNLLGARGIQDPKAVTGGIAQALLTTAAGLAVAIVTLLPFNYFNSRVRQVTRRIENAATRLEVAYRKGLGNNHATP